MNLRQIQHLTYMKKILVIISLLILVAVAYFLVHKKNTSVVETGAVVVQPLPEITNENVKVAKKALIEQLANDLYVETDKQLKNGEPVTYDDESIYDDIVKVDVEVELFPVEKPDFGSTVAEDTPENTLK